ncbi:MAG: glycyl-radical enzyme activating protein [Coriobacteriales bacterium]|jgi:pyruvate formate lyase activating enzyme|nr:glycyl-radical enzyme activating protein [Coriobacteriales bacterium]
MTSPTGLVFNVQSYSVHDGPGIRIEFFMKGCPLACEWCSNPEGISPRPEPGSYPSKCMGIADCGTCLKACKQGALLFTPEGTLGAVDREACIGCLACTEACFTGALTAWGTAYTVEEALELIRRDRAFFERTGGGVTISGGEALLQPDFVLAVFEQCQAEGINTCLESCLHVRQEVLEPFFEVTDLFIADIKHRDPAIHKARCGVSNERILANISYLARRNACLVLRTPILKGFNATDEAMQAIGDFILDELDNRVLQYQLLPYRQLGTEKYASLDRAYPMAGFEGYERAEWEPDIRRFLKLLQARGINAVSGNNTKF